MKIKPEEDDGGRIRVARITITNLLGIDELSFEPGKSFTLISGRNGSGKTSILESIRAIGGTHDATLIRKGAQEGKVVLVLDDGMQITKRETPTDGKLTVTHPTMGRVGKAAALVKSLTDVIALNPIEFLTGSDTDRLKWFLGAVPLHISSEQISQATGDPAHVASYKSACEIHHALPVLAEVEKQQFDRRTDVNRGLKEKRATIAQLFETLPAGSSTTGDADWKGQVEELDAQWVETIAADTAALAAVKADAQKRKAAKWQLHTHSLTLRAEQRGTSIAEVKRWEAAEVERIRATAAQRIDIIEAAHREATETAEAQARQVQAEIDATAHAACADLAAEQDARHAALSEDLGRAKAMAENQIKAGRTCEIINGMEAEAATLDTEATRLTTAIENVRELRTSLTASLPIKGVEVRDGQLFVDGIPERRINEARRVGIAIEIAKLRAGPLGLVVCDGLEDLDENSFAEFRTQAIASGLQLIVARVSNEPELTIKTEEDEVCVA